MTLEELYEYYDRCWVRVHTELKLGSSTVFKWRKRGYIPIKSQMLIEKRTNGLFKASFDDVVLETEE